MQEEVELLRRADECTKRVQKPSWKVSLFFLNINYITISSEKQKDEVPAADRQQLPLLTSFALESGVGALRGGFFGSTVTVVATSRRLKQPEVQVGKARVFLEA